MRSSSLTLNSAYSCRLSTCRHLLILRLKKVCEPEEVYGPDPCSLQLIYSVPYFLDHIFSQPQVIILEGEELLLFFNFNITELVGLVKILPFLYDLHAKQVTGRHHPFAYNIFIGLLGGLGIIGPNLDGTARIDIGVLDLCHMMKLYIFNKFE